MLIWSSLRIACIALGRNRLRTVLTVVGIAVGIGAVLCTVALGDGSAAAIERQLLDIGDNFIWIENGGLNVGGVRSGAGSGPPHLTADDQSAILENVQEITRCSPQVDSRVQIIAGNQNWNTTYRGVSPDYLQIKKWQVADGASITDADVQSRARVVVLGSSVARVMFPNADPLGQQMRLGTKPFTVVGVLKSRGQTATGIDQDDTLLLPYTTAQRLLKGNVYLDDIMCSATSNATIPVAQQRIVEVLRRQHRLADGAPDDFKLRAPDEAIRLQAETSRTMKLMLSAIASISLLVAGIGVMNIMLVSVAERTREIGLRMAIGARETHVKLQFLAEALVLGLVGGAAGVLTGALASIVFEARLGWPMLLSARTIMVAVGFSSAVGVVFGYYPARRAAQLDPIEALRTNDAPSAQFTGYRHRGDTCGALRSDDQRRFVEHPVRGLRCRRRAAAARASVQWEGRSPSRRPIVRGVVASAASQLFAPDPFAQSLSAGASWPWRSDAL